MTGTAACGGSGREEFQRRGGAGLPRTVSAGGGKQAGDRVPTYRLKRGRGVFSSRVTGFVAPVRGPFQFRMN